MNFCEEEKNKRCLNVLFIRPGFLRNEVNLNSQFTPTQFSKEGSSILYLLIIIIFYIILTHSLFVFPSSDQDFYFYSFHARKHNHLINEQKPTSKIQTVNSHALCHQVLNAFVGFDLKNTSAKRDYLRLQSKKSIAN